MLKFKFVRDGAKTPSVGHPGDLGFDLYAAESAMLYPGDTTLVPTGVAIELTDHDGTPLGVVIKDRSSIAGQGVVTSAGVIDARYRGELMIRMTYHPPVLAGNFPFAICKGDKIAQAIPVRPNTSHVMQMVDSFEETSRGTSGFGSTGK